MVKRFTDTWRESTTLKLVLVPWLLLVGKYAISDMDIGFGATTYIDPIMFAGAVALVLAPWLHREWRVARYNNTGKPLIKK